MMGQKPLDRIFQTPYVCKRLEAKNQESLQALRKTTYCAIKSAFRGAFKVNGASEWSKNDNNRHNASGSVIYSMWIRLHRTKIADSLSAVIDSMLLEGASFDKLAEAIHTVKKHDTVFSEIRFSKS